MTTREGYARVEAMLSNTKAEVKESAVVMLLKDATARFAAETAAQINTVTFTMDSSRDYTLPMRVGRIFRVESEVSNELRVLEGVDLAEIDGRYQTVTEGGATHPDLYARFGRTLRIYPQPGSGTLRVYHAPIPIYEDRSTPRGETLIASDGSTTTAALSVFSAPINNKAGVTDYYTPCKIVFESGPTNQSSFITSVNEGALLITFTFSPAVSTAVASTNTFRIEDVLEVPDDIALMCCYYAAGVIGNKQIWLDLFEARLRKERSRGFGGEPDTTRRMRDYAEMGSPYSYGG